MGYISYVILHNIIHMDWINGSNGLDEWGKLCIQMVCISALLQVAEHLQHGETMHILDDIHKRINHPFFGLWQGCPHETHRITLW